MCYSMPHVLPRTLLHAPPHSPPLTAMRHLSAAVSAPVQARVSVRMQLLETWCRKYQVAENRTHPEMNAYPPTGYVLSGVTVVPPTTTPE